MAGIRIEIIFFVLVDKKNNRSTFPWEDLAVKSEYREQYDCVHRKEEMIIGNMGKQCKNVSSA